MINFAQIAHEAEMDSVTFATRGSEQQRINARIAELNDQRMRLFAEYDRAERRGDNATVGIMVRSLAVTASQISRLVTQVDALS